MNVYEKKNKNLENNLKKFKFRGDLGVLVTSIILSLFGLLMIFSASAMIAYFNNDGDTFFFFKRQIIWILIGTIAGFLIYKIKLSKLKGFSIVIITIAIFLMIYMLPEALSPGLSDGTKSIKMPFVVTLNGATRWFDFGFLSVQPVELLKFGLVLFGAFWLSRDEKQKKLMENFLNQYRKNHNLYIFLKIIFKNLFTSIVIFSCGLIFAQRDLDTLIIVFLIYLIMTFVANPTRENYRKSLITLSLGIVFAFFAVMIEEFRRNRFFGFIEILLKGEPSREFREGFSFQFWNGLIAIGSGGLFGLGYGESRQKLFFLQEAAFTDSIFAILGEEFGLIGTIFVILLFLYILSKGISIAKNAPDKFYSLIAIGATAFIIVQAFLNIAANVGLIPFAGMAMPFFTYGGSNTIIILCTVGLLLNISREIKKF